MQNMKIQELKINHGKNICVKIPITNSEVFMGKVIRELNNLKLKAKYNCCL